MRPASDSVQEGTGSVNHKGRGLRIAGMVVAVTGVVFLCVGGWLALQAHRFQAAALRAEGEVVRLERSGDGAAPVFRFTTAAGTTHEAPHTIYSTPPAWRLGERATLLYSPAAPEGARPDSFIATWLMPGVFLVLGAVELLAAAILLALARRQARR